MKKIYFRNIYTKNDAGNVFFFSLLVPQFLGTTLYFIISMIFIFNGLNFDDSVFYTILMILSSQLGFLFVFLLYNKIFRFNIKKANKINFKFGIFNLIVSILIGLVVLFGFQNIINLFDVFLNFLGKTTSELPLPLDNGLWLLLNIVLLALLPAICEELIFRGVIFNGLKQYGIKKAIIGSALLFALIHGNIEQIIYPFIFGIVLALFVHKTGSILPAMLAHFCNNALVLIINYFSKGDAAYTFHYADIIIAFVTAGIAVVAIYYLSKLLKVKTKEEKTDDLGELREKALDMINNTNQDAQSSWEAIISQNKDLVALEKSAKQKNIVLWFAVFFACIAFFISSLISIIS